MRDLHDYRITGLRLNESSSTLAVSLTDAEGNVEQHGRPLPVLDQPRAIEADGEPDRQAGECPQAYAGHMAGRGVKREKHGAGRDRG